MRNSLCVYLNSCSFMKKFSRKWGQVTRKLSLEEQIWWLVGTSEVLVGIIGMLVGIRNLIRKSPLMKVGTANYRYMT